MNFKYRNAEKEKDYPNHYGILESLGGGVSCWAALKYPARVKGLALNTGILARPDGVGLKQLDFAANTAEAACWAHPAHRGKGVIVTALTAVLRFGFGFRQQP